MTKREMVKDPETGKKFMIIPLEEFNYLLEQERKLTALEAHGVDNWEWYEDALGFLEKDENGE